MRAPGQRYGRNSTRTAASWTAAGGGTTTSDGSTSRGCCAKRSKTSTTARAPPSSCAICSSSPPTRRVRDGVAPPSRQRAHSSSAARRSRARGSVRARPAGSRAALHPRCIRDDRAHRARRRAATRWARSSDRRRALRAGQLRQRFAHPHLAARHDDDTRWPDQRNRFGNALHRHYSNNAHPYGLNLVSIRYRTGPFRYVDVATGFRVATRLRCNVPHHRRYGGGRRCIATSLKTPGSALHK